MRFHNRVILAAVLLAASLFGSVAAQTPMLTGTPAAVTGATNANPPVISFASGALGATNTGDYVFIQNVGGNTAVNGVFSCSAVSATSCTLAGPIGNGAYTSGGTIQLLGVVANGASAPFDCSPCIKSAVLIYANGTPNMTITLEGTSSSFARVLRLATGDIPLPSTPWTTMRTISSSDLAAVDPGFITPATNVNQLRVRVASWVSGTAGAVLTCNKANGDRVW